MIREIELSGNVLPGEISQQNDNIQVVKDKLVIKVCKIQEELDVLDFLGLQPVLNNLYFIVRHGKIKRRKNVSQILYQLRVKLIFLCFGIKASLAEMLEYFLHMLVIYRHVIRINEYIVQIDHNTDIQKIKKRLFMNC